MKRTIMAVGVIALLYAGLWGVKVILQQIWLEHEIEALWK